MTYNGERIESIELVFPDDDVFGFNDRDEIEDYLTKHFSEMIEVSGAGAGLGVYELALDVQASYQDEPQTVIKAIQNGLSGFQLPTGSYLWAYPTSAETFKL